MLPVKNAAPCCAIPGCKVEPHKKVVMCWPHIRMLPAPMQKTLDLLSNDGQGKPRPGYAEACTSAVEQVRELLGG